MSRYHQIPAFAERLPGSVATLAEAAAKWQLVLAANLPHFSCFMMKRHARCK